MEASAFAPRGSMRAYRLLLPLGPLLALVTVASCGSNGNAPPGNAGTDGGSHAGDDGGSGSSGGGGSGSNSGGGSSSGGGSGGGSGSSSGGHGGSSGSNGDDAGVDAAVSEACVHCVQVRCDATAVACENDSTCAAAELAVEQCINACQPNTDCSYCEGTASAQVQDLYNCHDGACLMPCLDGPATNQACSPLGDPCDPLDPGYACCQPDGGTSVTCEQPGTSLGCCLPVGASCDPASTQNYCCTGESLAGGCQSTSGGGSCSASCYALAATCDSALPCCSDQQTCTDLGASFDGGPETFLCCDKDSPPGQCYFPCPGDAGASAMCGF
jgi:hypothetical protein